VLSTLSRLTPPQLPWASLYWLFTIVSLVMVLVVWLARFPHVEHTEAERPGSLDVYAGLLRRPMVWLYFFAIFAYVGCEQGTANWISQFLSEYHHFDPHLVGAAAVSWFWGLMTAGCVVGAVLLKLYDSRRILICFAAGALLCLSLGLFAPAQVSRVAFPAIGFFASVMWPVLISLALNSVAENHGSFTGILATGIVGGAIMPAVIGRIGDHLGLKSGLLLLYVTFTYILSVGFWAKPLVNNETLRSKRAELSPTA
jgi:MFS transporter, FHS family, L-fucose permease